MADYWKSQARKYCDFCKCWIADNKPSIQFHETGKRHKENVAQKLALLTKRSVKEQKESLKVDEEMRKMEEAAMKAYMKDIESNPDYTSKCIIDKVEEKRKQEQEQVELEQRQLRVKDGKGKMTDDTKNEKEHQEGGVAAAAAETGSQQQVWYEAQSDEGYTYYWNYLTAESVWEPPKEGYVSIAEQQNSSSLTESEAPSDLDVDKNTEVQNDKVDCKRLESATENKKKRKKDNSDCDISASEKSSDILTPLGRGKEDESGVDQVVVGPSMKPDPYGGWTVVENRIPEPVDLQLPQQDYIEIKVPVVESEQPQIKFKEKTVTSLSNTVDGPSTFKKRKFSTNRSNMRRKFGDDDDDDIG